MRAYHGDFIPEKSFKRWYLPDNIPDVRPRRAVFSGGDKLDLEEYARRKLRARQQEQEMEEEMEKKGMAPVGSLMFVEVERRLDVFLFRCCFVHSVYEARRLIIHGYVKLNGVKVGVLVLVSILVVDFFLFLLAVVSMGGLSRGWHLEIWFLWTLVPCVSSNVRLECLMLRMEATSLGKIRMNI